MKDMKTNTSAFRIIALVVWSCLIVMPMQLCLLGPPDLQSIEIHVDKADTVVAIANLMRSKGLFVVYEAPADGVLETKRIVTFQSEMNLSVAEALKAIGDSTKLMIRTDGNVIRMFNPEMVKDDKYPLNIKIDNVEINNIYAVDAVKLIAQTATVHIVNDSMAHDQPGNYVALSLKSLNIRDALDQISTAAGFHGWNCYPSVVGAGRKKGVK